MYGFYDTGGQPYHHLQMEEKKMTNEYKTMACALPSLSLPQLSSQPGLAVCRHTKRSPTMPVQLEGKAINTSQGGVSGKGSVQEHRH